MAQPFAPAPPGTTLSDCARRNPSEIPSQTQSVSAFLPGTVPMGLPVPPANCAPGLCHPCEGSPQQKKIERGQAAYKPGPLTRRLVQCPATCRCISSDRCVVGGECSDQLPGRLNLWWICKKGYGTCSCPARREMLPGTFSFPRFNSASEQY